MARVDLFIDEVPEYEIRDNIMYIQLADGRAIAFPLRSFRLGMARAAKALATYDSRKAEVLPMRKRKGGEH